MTKCHPPPIVCDLYNVVRKNALVKDSQWVRYVVAYLTIYDFNELSFNSLLVI